MDLLAIDEALRAEHRRITGSTNPFEYLRWITQETRAAARALHVNPDRAWYAWGALLKAERNRVLLEHLRAQPPAAWPTLQLVHDAPVAVVAARRVA